MNATHKNILAVAAIVLFMMAVGTPCYAEEFGGPEPLTVIKEWKSGKAWDKGFVALSSNGMLVAHVNAHTDPAGAGLFVQDIASGNDNLILREVEGKRLTGHVAFSPDGSQLAFDGGGFGGTPTMFDGSIYTIGADGSDLVHLAPSSDQAELAPTDPSVMAACKANPWVQRSDQIVTAPECSLSLKSIAPYSPDGGKIMVSAMVNSGQRNNEGLLSDQNTQSYVGILPTNAARRDPAKFVDGAMFWSSDGNAIYYHRKGAVYRLDLQTAENQATGIDSNDILGKVPGIDAVFVRKGSAVAIVSLHASELNDATTTDPQLAKAAARIPLQDSEKRDLTEIQVAPDAQRFLLMYYAASSTQDEGYKKQHAQLMSWASPVP